MPSIVVGDCREVLAAMEPESIDACVTDPPYEIAFMGRAWDRSGVSFDPATWAAIARVLKPGAHLLAFGGTRTSHRIACAIEDAGFEIRDTIAWITGQGFPKSLDVGKAMDRAAGAERPIVGSYVVAGTAAKGKAQGRASVAAEEEGATKGLSRTLYRTAPATDLAREWEGWGTAIKPSHEPIVVARKPLIGTVAANVERFSTGALNIDASRIGTEDRLSQGSRRPGANFDDDGYEWPGTRGEQHAAGRWPANVCLDEFAAAALDAQSGVSTSKRAERGKGIDGPTFRHQTGEVMGVRGHSDTGGASRFFYTAKASRVERNAGLEGMPERMPDNAIDRATQRSGAEGAAGRGSHSLPRANMHPTVKPLSLMSWLIKLCTPPGGVVLDPFMGSGSTGCAAALGGFEFIGIEIDETYAEIARRRIAHAAGPLFAEVS